MLSDKDLLDIMRMRAAVAPKENRVADDETARTSQAESPGAAATLGTRVKADEQQAAAASEGNAEQLPDSPAECFSFFKELCVSDRNRPRQVDKKRGFRLVKTLTWITQVCILRVSPGRNAHPPCF